VSASKIIASLNAAAEQAAKDLEKLERLNVKDFMLHATEVLKDVQVTGIIFSWHRPDHMIDVKVMRGEEMHHVQVHLRVDDGDLDVANKRDARTYLSRRPKD
jgi:hypothetical protein